MIISKARNYVFVHIPKTGGTALTLALEDRAAKDDLIIGDTPKAKRRRHRLDDLQPNGRLWKHSKLADIDGVISAEELDNMFCFTLVRNPWDRMVSYYFWLQEQTFAHPAVALAKSNEFEAFLRHSDTVRTIQNAPARYYMTNVLGRERADAYVRLECLQEDLKPVEKHLGFKLSVERVNTSKRHRDYRGYYDETLAEFVGTLCAEDIRRFDYAF